MPTPKPTFTTKTESTHVHEVSTRKPDYIDVLTVLLLVATFILGYYFTGLVESRKERKRLSDIKEYFLSLAESLVRAGQDQSIRIADAISRLQALKGNNFSVIKMAELNNERIREIPNLDLYKVFIATKKYISSRMELLNALTAVLNVMDASIAYMNKHNEKIATITEPFHRGYGDKINDILRKKDELFFKMGRNEIVNRPNVQNLIDIVDDIIVSRTERNYGSQNLFNEILGTHEAVCKPFYESPRLQTVIKDSGASPILVVANNLRGDYVTFVSTTQSLSRELAQTNNRINESIHILSAIIKNLKD